MCGKSFTQLNVKNRYNLISIAEGDEWKTDIYTKQELFEYTVMLFGETNILVSLQKMMDTIFQGIERSI